MFDWLLKRLNSFTITNKAGNAYLRRYYLWRTRWFNVYVHEILRSDEDRELHDHPWSFLSVILKGAYIEHLPGGLTRFCPRGSMIYHRAEDAHRLDLDPRYGIAWTLVIVGRKHREWGFHTAIGWMNWRDYLDLKFGQGKWVDEPEFQGGVAKLME